MNFACEVEMKIMAVMMTDCMSIMETGRCPTCGSIVQIDVDQEGDVNGFCPTCKARFGFSAEFFCE